MWPFGSNPPEEPIPHDEHSLRYAAYATRIRTLLVSAHRFVAYTSEVGESFRPVAHPYLVRGAYAVSWTYILGDVGLEGYHAFQRSPAGIAAAKARSKSRPKGEEDGVMDTVTDMTQGLTGPLPKSYSSATGDYRAVMLERAVFQSLASMALPAFTIHSVVKFSGKAMKGMQNAFLRTWGPVGLGLSVVPLLPTLFDEPVEHAVQWSFHTAMKSYFGEEKPKSLWEKIKGKTD